MPEAKKKRINQIIEYVLSLLVLVSVFTFVHLSMIQELQDPDIWTHLKTGEYILQHGRVPKTDIFSSTVAGKSWLEHTWLLKLIYYLVFHYGGVDNLLLLSSFVALLAFLILFFSAYRQRPQLTLILGILFLTVFSTITRFNIRPENFSWLFLALYIFILTRGIRKKWVFFLPLVQLLWVNYHIYFVLGPFLIGVLLLCEIMKRRNLLPEEWSRVELLDERSYRRLVKVFLLVCAACLINPYGWKGALGPFWTTFSAAGKSSIFYQHIRELLPSWWLSYRAIFAYYVLAALSLLAFLLNFRRLNIAFFLIWLVFLALSLRVNRFNICFNFIAFFTAVDNLTRTAYFKKLNVIQASEKAKTFFKYAILIPILIYTLKINNNLLNSQYYIYEENRYKSGLLGITNRIYPEGAADFMLAQALPGNIFNLFNDGSYLIYRLYPERKVFIDGRTELYGGDFFKDYLKILSLNENVIELLFKKYNINTVFLSGNVMETNNFAAYLFANPSWQLVYLDSDSLIFLKDTPENQALIKKLKIDFKNWQVAEADLNKLGLRGIFPRSYIGRAWKLYYLGLDEPAIKEAKEALKILPSNADTYNIIGRVYLKNKSPDEAFEYLRLSWIYAASNTETLISLGSFYLKTNKTDYAIKTYKKLTKLNPRFSEGPYLLALAYRQKNNFPRAEKSLRRAIQVNPYNPKYYKELIDLLNQKRASTEAKPKGPQSGCLFLRSWKSLGLGQEEKSSQEVNRIYQQALSLGLDTRDFSKNPSQ